METFEVRIDRTGRVLIPVAVRRELGLAEGSRLLIRKHGDGFELLTVDSAVRRAQQLVRKRIPAGRSLVDELIRERRREAKRG
jgi:AbrB family looped-hinge helix DNA binding protein